jgi:UPF0755 protein
MLIFACLGVMGWIWAGVQLPKMAAQRFGPASPALGYSDRILYSARVLAAERSLLRPREAQAGLQSFHVSLGEPVHAIAGRLEQEGVIRSAESFRTYLIYSGLDTSLQAGKYEISAAMNAVEIARTLQDAVPEEVDFVILAGWRVEEVAAALPTSGLAIAPADFLDLVRMPPLELLPEGVTQGTPLEGFLMPGRYSVRRETTTYELLAMLIRQFEETVTQEVRDGYTAQGLDLHQAVTLASIVQREAVVADEQPVIASVFYNRLASGMRLESDPTSQYALGYQPSSNSWWKNPLSLNDLKTDSRYNTYRVFGLPPGPICNPGAGALRAVAYPAQTGYFFFRAKCDGSGRHSFAVTFDEHLQNACP